MSAETVAATLTAALVFAAAALAFSLIALAVALDTRNQHRTTRHPTPPRRHR